MILSTSCNVTNKEDLLVVYEFAKAFDMPEWSFVEDSLNLLNFGPSLIAMVKPLQNHSFSSVEQNGYFPSNKLLSRGYAGKEISSRNTSLLFVLKSSHSGARL